MYQSPVKKGVTEGQLNKLESALSTYETLKTRYGSSKNTEIQWLCLMATANSIEHLLVLGKTEQAIPFINQVLEQVDPSDQNSAIMSFLLWLAQADTPVSFVLDSIKALSKEVKFTWDWEAIHPFVDQLVEPRKAQAEAFIAYFEQHQNIETLEATLGQNS